MTTVYVAAEKLMTWTPDGQLAIDKKLVQTLASHSKNNRFIAFFAPSRFGLWFEDRREVEDAWHYLEHALNSCGFFPDDVFLFPQDVEETPFICDSQKQGIQDSISLILSDSPEDENLSLSLGIQKVSQLPANISSMWQKIDIRRTLRSVIAAAFQP